MDIRNAGCFHPLGRGDRDILARQADDRLFQIIEGLFLQGGRQLGPNTGRHAVLGHDKSPPDTRDQFDHGVAVERVQATEFDHLRLDAVLDQFLGGSDGARDHARMGDDTKIAARPAQLGLSQVRALPSVELTLHGVQALVLDEDHGIGLPQCLAQ